MRTIHAMIAEDEQLAREDMIYLLEKEPDVVLCPSAETGNQLVDLYVAHEPDVIFLDVEMPGMTGVEAVKQIVELAYIQPPLFIFTTAYDEYAMDAFEIEAVDYLLKPYDDTRFQKTMRRIRKQMAQTGMKQEKHAETRTDQAPEKLLIDDGERMVVLSPDSIYYAVPSNRMLEIHTRDEVIESRMTLQELEDRLKGFSFFRTHRSYLVNLDYVREITPWFNGAYNLTLKDKNHTTLPVSRAARKFLLEMFKN
ncbi:LytR/AlgR family response regulator transcription factor [Lentibacillus amyloliquefaciens]|uniref:Two-component system response regulator n=1 Tax=Lentibacillus amyloliquefaciens TaxID=1472767 RepID=A0A0U3W9C1_9BACI|nr:LytTR family DNA-binding domain-containing protein [Lentibacillus amyloliquefaciens]ALX49634.1 two-component system response regulator [Lentibacillus amyloliquefaciens]